jgi:hypothetical protein
MSSNVSLAGLGGAKMPASGVKVDVSRGERVGRVSSEWFSRPDDERYLSLSALYESARSRAERATAQTVESRAIRVEASRDDAERLALIMPGREVPVTPTHWSFGQLCGLVGAPSGYLRDLPAPLAGIVIDPDGQEATASYAVYGETVQIGQTAREFLLRDGDTVLNIYNLGFDTVGGNPATGTTSPQVTRAIDASGSSGVSARWGVP